MEAQLAPREDVRRVDMDLVRDGREAAAEEVAVEGLLAFVRRELARADPADRCRASALTSSMSTWMIQLVGWSIVCWMGMPLRSISSDPVRRA
ncbi:hypothetical protein ACH4XT_00370 [Streptomyces avidinii]|uniref:hypothetical protein n=1 Tax=Streptomyces avidinii TaxID=1895 RepID=UPI0037A6F3F3